MNPTQIGGIARDLVKYLGMFMVAHGVGAGLPWEWIAGLLGALTASGFSYSTNSTTSQISAVAASPEVKLVVTTPAIAIADPSPKVVPVVPQ